MSERLIYANALKNIIETDDGLKHARKLFSLYIDDAPTIDPETLGYRKVVRGRWINNGDYVTTAYGNLDVYECSNCNAEVTINEHDNFCPSCGAQMDAEGGEG